MEERETEGEDLVSGITEFESVMISGIVLIPSLLHYFSAQNRKHSREGGRASNIRVDLQIPATLKWKRKVVVASSLSTMFWRGSEDLAHRPLAGIVWPFEAPTSRIFLQSVWLAGGPWSLRIRLSLGRKFVTPKMVTQKKQ